MICGSEGSKSRLAKAGGAEPSGQMRMKDHFLILKRRFVWQICSLPKVSKM